MDTSLLRSVVNHPTVHPRRLAAAFTLVELLVVIGIIALLIGILMPALSGARRASQLTKCLAVQRQIGTAAANYASTHRGFYPLAGNLTGPKSVDPVGMNDTSERKYTYLPVTESPPNPKMLACWMASLAPLMGKKTALEGGNNTDLLGQEVGIKSYLNYFICPAHMDISGDVPESLIYQVNGTSVTSGWTVQQSYVVNECVFGMSGGRLEGNSTKIKQPSMTVMLADGLAGLGRSNPFVGAPGWMTFVNYKSLLDPANLPMTLADAYTPPNIGKFNISSAKAGDPKSFDVFRHKGKINILFCDGHAETRLISSKDLASVYLFTRN